MMHSFRFGVFEYQNYEEVNDFRVERYLPKVSKNITLLKTPSGHQAKYEISNNEFHSYLDGLWDKYGERSAVKREDFSFDGTPILDRIDLHLEVMPLSEEELMNKPKGESSSVIRERVLEARAIQNKRYDLSTTKANSAMSPMEIQLHCELDVPCRELMKMAINELNMSARAYDRILRVSRTVADLAGSENIATEHISEAIQFRSLDRGQW
ncbi:MAG: hypothetical protein MJH11_17130 [Lentisphaeria bacterium]|nr:hypothetical protein [Lentisphaeria bacterium]